MKVKERQYESFHLTYLEDMERYNIQYLYDNDTVYISEIIGFDVGGEVVIKLEDLKEIYRVIEFSFPKKKKRKKEKRFIEIGEKASYNPNTERIGFNTAWGGWIYIHEWVIRRTLQKLREKLKLK